MPASNFEKRGQQFRASKSATEEEYGQANCSERDGRGPACSQGRKCGFGPEAYRGRSPAENRSPQSSQARDDAIARRLPFRPNPTAPADYTGKTGIGQVTRFLHPASEHAYKARRASDGSWEVQEVPAASSRYNVRVVPFPADDGGGRAWRRTKNTGLPTARWAPSKASTSTCNAALNLHLGRDVRLSLDEHPHLDYGYAVTSYRSQGTMGPRCQSTWTLSRRVSREVSKNAAIGFSEEPHDQSVGTLRVRLRHGNLMSGHATTWSNACPPFIRSVRISP